MRRFVLRIALPIAVTTLCMPPAAAQRRPEAEVLTSAVSYLVMELPVGEIRIDSRIVGREGWSGDHRAQALEGVLGEVNRQRSQRVGITRKALIVFALVGAGLPPCADVHGRDPDDDAVHILATALSHARTIAPEGRLQVDPAKFPGDRRLVEAAASRIQAGYGPGMDVAECDRRLGCRPLGAFRGVVEVLDLRRPEPDSAVVTMDTIRLRPRGGAVYSVVNQIHLERASNGAWSIVRW